MAVAVLLLLLVVVVVAVAFVVLVVLALVLVALVALVVLVAWCVGRRPRVESTVWTRHGASGSGGSIYTAGVGVACIDSHACHAH